MAEQETLEQETTIAERIESVIDDGRNETQETVEPTEETQDTPKETVEESETTKWARVKQLEKQNRELLNKVKAAEKFETLETIDDKLRALGVTEQDLWDHLVGTAEVEAPKEEPKTDKELEAVKQKIQQFEQQQQQQAEVAAFNSEVAAVKEFIADKSEYIGIRDTGNYGLVVEVARNMARDENPRTQEHAYDIYERALQATEETIRSTKKKQYEELTRLEWLRGETNTKEPERNHEETKTISAKEQDTPTNWDQLSVQERIEAIIKQGK